jgi:hypothetical protein
MSDGVGEAMCTTGAKHEAVVRSKESVAGLAQKLNDNLKNSISNAAHQFYDGLKDKGTDDFTLMVIPVN